MAALTHSVDANCAETCLDIVSEAFVDVLTWLSDHAGAFLDSLAQVCRPSALVTWDFQRCVKAPTEPRSPEALPSPAPWLSARWVARSRLNVATRCSFLAKKLSGGSLLARKRPTRQFQAQLGSKAAWSYCPLLARSVCATERACKASKVV